MPLESPYPIISIEDALAVIHQNVRRLPTISVALSTALDYVLAADVTAAEPMPPFPASSVS